MRVDVPAPALAKLSAADLEVLEGFFARRLDMDLATRAALANRKWHQLYAPSPGLCNTSGYKCRDLP